MIKEPRKKKKISGPAITEGLSLEQVRDIHDKLAYRELFGKKRSDDFETDKVLDKMKSKIVGSAK